MVSFVRCFSCHYDFIFLFFGIIYLLFYFCYVHVILFILGYWCNTCFEDDHWTSMWEGEHCPWAFKFNFMLWKEKLDNYLNAFSFFAWSKSLTCNFKHTFTNFCSLKLFWIFEHLDFYFFLKPLEMLMLIFVLKLAIRQLNK